MLMERGFSIEKGGEVSPEEEQVEPHPVAGRASPT